LLSGLAPQDTTAPKPNSSRILSQLPTMPHLAAMKAACQTMDIDNDGKLTFDEFLCVPLWFEPIISEFSSPEDMNSKTSFFIKKLKHALFQIFRQPPIQTDEVSSKGTMPHPDFFKKVDYLEVLVYFCADWIEGEGLRKALWIAGNPPGKPVSLQTLMTVLAPQAAQSDPAKQILQALSIDLNRSLEAPITTEDLLSVPNGRALVERAYDRFTLKNVKPLLKISSQTITPTKQSGDVPQVMSASSMKEYQK